MVTHRSLAFPRQAIFEKLIARRFFGRKMRLPRMAKHMWQQRHRILCAAACASRAAGATRTSRRRTTVHGRRDGRAEGCAGPSARYAEDILRLNEGAERFDPAAPGAHLLPVRRHHRLRVAAVRT